jgi:hypothetical protein
VLDGVGSARTKKTAPLWCIHSGQSVQRDGFATIPLASNPLAHFLTFTQKMNKPPEKISLESFKPKATQIQSKTKIFSMQKKEEIEDLKILIN